jgi:hypothetical protein
MEIKMDSFTEIPFDFNMKQLFDYLRIEPGTDRAKAFEDLVNEVRKVGKPKALYKASFIDNKGEDTITIDGATFESLALRKNLDSIERVFPYVATCGTEIDDIEAGQGDLQKKMWISVLKEKLLNASMHFLGENLAERYRISNLSSMNPGSGDASVWPFEQQGELFNICGDAEKLIGVSLTKSMVLVPDMSLAGIFFPTEVDFQSCQLCHRENCLYRRAPFDKELWDSINQN